MDGDTLVVTVDLGFGVEVDQTLIDVAADQGMAGEQGFGEQRDAEDR